MNFQEKILSINDLSVSYQGHRALQQLSFSVFPEKITGIIGPNGAGKSTLMKSIMGLLVKDRGTVLLDGKPLTDYRKKIAYVEQRSELDLTFPINVEEVVRLGTFPKLGLLKRPGKKEKQLATAALEKVGMQEYKKRQIGELSGGQLQRVFIARALAQEAEIIFLDEPFAGIDMVSEQMILSLLKQLRQEGKMILIVHHDLHKTREYFDDLVILNKKLVAAGPVEQVFNERNLRFAYGDIMSDLMREEGDR